MPRTDVASFLWKRGNIGAHFASLSARCNYQFAANWVVGTEADASWANPQGGSDSSQQTQLATLFDTSVVS
jgi:hypothetical protein